MTKTYIRYGLLIILLAACIGIASHYVIDFTTLYRTARIVHARTLELVYADLGGRYFYGPISLVLIDPIGAMPFPVAKWFWIFLQTISFLAFWRLLGRLYPFLNRKEAFWPWVIVWILSVNPLHNNFQSNNIQIMLAALLFLGEVFSHEGKQKQFWAGFLVTLAGAIKVFPLFIAAYYFFCRPRPVKLGVVAGALFSIGIPFLYFGLAGGELLFRSFFANVTTYQADNPWGVPDILCLPSLLARFFSHSPYLSWILRGSVLLLSVAFFLFAYRRENRTVSPKPRTEIHLWALGNAMMVFLNPSTRPHYFLFYVPAFCSLFELKDQFNARARAWLFTAIAMATLLIAFTAEFVVGHARNDDLERANLPTYGMAVLVVALTSALFSLSRRGKLTTS